MAKTKIPEVSLSVFLKHSLDIVKNPLPFHHKNFTEKGDIFCLNLGLFTKVYFCRDAALITYVLQKNQKNYTKSKIQTRDLAKYIGKGLLTSEGQHWKKQRQLIQPAFHKKQLNALLETIQNAILLEYKRIKPSDTTIDIFPIFNDLAFQTVVKSLFSSAANQDTINRLQYITEAAQKMLVKELRQPYLRWWFKLGGQIKRHINLITEARDTLQQMVSDRKAAQTTHNDLLDMLLDARYDDGNPMEDEQLIDEILILFAAGHETTSNALTFTCQLLALHPKWQDKIFEEFKSVKEESDDLMTQIMASKICQNVIEEAMRLYPPAYFVDRVNHEEDTFNEMRFKSGSNLLFSIYEIHRHPELWDNPNEFLPDRFAEGSRKFSSQYFPFGAGPRKCIGNNFAMFEMIIAIRELVSQYKIYPDFETIEITPLITLKPKNAILKFEAR